MNLKTAAEIVRHTPIAPVAIARPYEVVIVLARDTCHTIGEAEANANELQRIRHLVAKLSQEFAIPVRSEIREGM